MYFLLFKALPGGLFVIAAERTLHVLIVALHFR